MPEAGAGESASSPRGRSPLADRYRRDSGLVWAVGAALVAVGVLLRLATIAEDPLHPDECLYASWAAAVWPGGDLLLNDLIIDKPPLFSYLLAAWSAVFGPGPTALRLLGAASALAGMMAALRIARAVAGRWPALAAVAFMALSPVGIALDATAFTDPPAVALALWAVAAAVGGRPAVSGLLIALAAAAKPTALAYAPLLLALTPGWRRREWASFVGGAIGVAALVGMWEVARAPEVGFLPAALANFGLGRPDASFDGPGWAALLPWAWGGTLAMVVWGVLVASGVAAATVRRPRAARLLLGAGLTVALYLGLHWAIAAPPWDRYLLGLVAPVSLAAAGALGCLGASLRPRASTGLGVAVTLAATLALAGPAQEAAQSRLPLGDTSAWQGIETVAAYVRGQVPGRATILYRGLGWHIRYYMAGFPQDFRWYQEVGELAETAGRADPVYLLTEVNEAGQGDVDHLRSIGFAVIERLATYRYDGSRALTVYQVSGGPR